MSEGVIDTARFDKYLFLADRELNIISVFDDIRYDRADPDILSIGMRRHVIKQLAKQNFKQVSGRVLQQASTHVRCLIPKFHAFGVSPFDAVRYESKREDDYYVLTPTQTACQFLNHYPLNDAIGRIETLIAKQPINVLRMLDFSSSPYADENFVRAIEHFMYVQRDAVSREPLNLMRPLG
ncbi:MAG: hypothetical protein AAF465_09530 [Pseudomonadota bacterium]